MTSRITAALTSVLLVTAGFGCKESAAGRPPAETAETLPDGAALTSGPECSGLVTGADLRTPEVKNGGADGKLVYELYVVDCSGGRQPLGGQRIVFDVEAEIGELLTSPYTLRIADAARNGEVSGALTGVEGEDVFGRRGPEYFHHQTDRIPADADIRSVVLTIDLAGQNFYPVGGGNERQFRARTHLKVGNAAPVTQTVTFVD